MQSKLDKINSVEQKLVVTVPSERVNEAFTSAYKRYQKKAKIQGFRQGKAPLYLIKKAYMEQALYDVSDALINENMKVALDEHELNPIASPQITDLSQLSQDQEFSFTATITIYPTIDLNDAHKALEVSYPVKDFNEDSCGEELEKLRRYSAKSAPIEDAEATLQANGHLAVVTCDAELEGQKIQRYCLADKRVAMGFNEMPKEIEEKIIGLKKGESTEFNAKLSADAELADKELHFNVTLTDLMTFDLPALDDTFAKEFKQETIQGLKDIIRKNLVEQNDRANQAAKENALLSALKEKVSFDVPMTITNQVIDSMIQDMYGKHPQVKELLKNKELRKNLIPEAESKAKNTMLLWEVAKAEKIEASDDEIKEAISKSLGEQDKDKADEVFANSKERVRENLVFEKTLSALESLAKLNPTK